MTRQAHRQGGMNLSRTCVTSEGECVGAWVQSRRHACWVSPGKPTSLGGDRSPSWVLTKQQWRPFKKGCWFYCFNSFISNEHHKRAKISNTTISFCRFLCVLLAKEPINISPSVRETVQPQVLTLRDRMQHIL